MTQGVNASERLSPSCSRRELTSAATFSQILSFPTGLLRLRSARALMKARKLLLSWADTVQWLHLSIHVEQTSHAEGAHVMLFWVGASLPTLGQQGAKWKHEWKEAKSLFSHLTHTERFIFWQKISLWRKKKSWVQEYLKNP